MSVKVYAIPDDLTPSEQDWQYDDVTDMSFSARTGFRRATQTQRRRLLATLSYANDHTSLGRIEVIRDYLRGGVNAVQIAWKPDGIRTREAGQAVIWENDDPATVTWQNGSAQTVTWSNSREKVSVAAVDGNKATVKGLTAGKLVVMAGELLERVGLGGVFLRAIDTVTADSSGQAVIRVQDSGTVFVGDLLLLGASQTIFMHPVSPITVPRRANTLSDPVTIELRQIFPDEIPGYTLETPWA